MNSRWTFPLLAIASGCVGAGLRYGQLRTGFDPTTGLPISGNLYAIGLLVCFVLLGVVAVLSTRASKRTPINQTFSQAFQADTPILTWMVCGILLLACSGALMVYSAFGVSQLHLITGLAVAFGAVSLLTTMKACKYKHVHHVDGIFLLISVVGAVILLIISYREVSINPVLWSYSVEILALSAVLLALFQLSAFAFGLGSMYNLYRSCILAVALSLTTLADGHSLAYTLYFAGSAIMFSGYMIACQVHGKPRPRPRRRIQS